MNFFKCGNCQSVAMEIIPGEQACEKTYQELKANSTDAAGEKHVPVIVQSGDKVTVTVGEIDHPMLPEHYIMYIYLETSNGGMLKKLEPGAKPCAEFLLSPGEKPVTAYEYCNLHGLWKAVV